MSILTAPVVQPRWQGVIHQYAQYLPVTEATPVVTLNEGNTPLIHARNFVEATVIWGDHPPSEHVFGPDDCWALRRGQQRQVGHA